MFNRPRNHHHEDRPPRLREWHHARDRQRGGRRSHGREEEESGFGEHFGGPAKRARRGEARYVLLDALREGPRHGYEIIRYLEERSSGRYVPSPGTVYPTLQYLEDLGLVRADRDGERRIFHLTDAGRAELEAHSEEIKAFWERRDTPPESAASQTELDFLKDELEQLARTVGRGLRAVQETDDSSIARRIRQAVEKCQGEIRQILTDNASSENAAPTEEPHA